MKINDEGTSNAAYWHERAMKAEARIKPLEETVAAQYAHNVLLEVLFAEAERLLRRLKFLRVECITHKDNELMDDWREFLRATSSADVCTWPACGCKRGSDHECAQGYARDANNG